MALWADRQAISELRRAFSTSALSSSRAGANLVTCSPNGLVILNASRSFAAENS